MRTETDEANTPMRSMLARLGYSERGLLTFDGSDKVGFEKVLRPVTVRDATLEDAERLLEIYSYYVESTAITFEYEVPSLDEFRGRMARTMERYPYIVIEQDGEVLGYAYAGPFVGRAAYDWSCELTVYLDHEVRGGGLGKRIYAALEDRLKAMGILNLYACIGYPKVEDEHLTRNSEGFHHHLGFETVGRFHDCGYKFGTWYDMIWMEKITGEHLPEQPPVRFGDKK